MKDIRFGALYLSIFLTVASPNLTWATSSVAQVCKDKKNYLSAASKNAISVDQMIQTALKDNSDVVFIGVEHGNFEHQVYPNLIQLIQNKLPQADCFFIEDSVGAEDTQAINEFNQGVEGSNVKLMSRFEWTYDFFLFLKKRGLKIHYVDFPGKDSMPLKNKDDVLSWLNARDKFMASQIAKFKKSNECHTAIFPIGLSHLVKVPGRHDLKNRLTETELKTSEILLLIAGRNSANPQYDYPLINPSLIWFKSYPKTLTPSLDQLICQENPSIPTKPYAFLNSPTNVPIAYQQDEQNFLGTFGEFQGTIIYGCQNEECVKENKIIEQSLRDKNVSFY